MHAAEADRELISFRWVFCGRQAPVSFQFFDGEQRVKPVNHLESRGAHFAFPARQVRNVAGVDAVRRVSCECASH